MRINLKKELKGDILDIGGGRDGIIGRHIPIKLFQ